MSMTTIEQQIEELGALAAGLEISAADPTTPYWMRAQDAIRAVKIRDRQRLLCQGLRKCATEGCTSIVGGEELCPRCAEKTASEVPGIFENWKDAWLWVGLVVGFAILTAATIWELAR